MNILAYQFYSEGFFGYGVQGDFKYWSWMHFLPIVLMILAILLIFFLKDKIKNWKYEENFRFIFIFIMLLFEMGFFGV